MVWMGQNEPFSDPLFRFLKGKCETTFIFVLMCIWGNLGTLNSIFFVGRHQVMFFKNISIFTIVWPPTKIPTSHFIRYLQSGAVKSKVGEGQRLAPERKLDLRFRNFWVFWTRGTVPFRKISISHDTQNPCFTVLSKQKRTTEVNYVNLSHLSQIDQTNRH